MTKILIIGGLIVLLLTLVINLLSWLGFDPKRSGRRRRWTPARVLVYLAMLFAGFALALFGLLWLLGRLP